MNKLNKIVSMAIMAITMTAFSQNITVIERKNIDGKTVVTTNVVDALEYITAKSAEISQRTGWNNIGFYNDELRQIETVETFKQIEDVLYANKVFTDPRFGIWKKESDTTVKFPKLAMNWSAMCIEKFPELSELTESALESTDANMVNAYVTIANSYFNMSTDYRIHPHSICNVSAPFIRKQLHKEGKTFVTKNGVNPIQQRMNAIVTALNAYRLQGLDLALHNAGVDFGLSFESRLVSEEQVETIKEDVLGGMKDFCAYKDFLRLHLGVVKFNEFVDKYNNGEMK